MDFESCQSGNQPMKKRVAEVCKVCRRLKSRHACARGKMCVCKEFVARKKMDVVGRKKMESSVNLVHEQRLGSCFVEEVADELVAEFSDPGNSLSSLDQQYDEKNIRRKVYDALNVLMAMDIISKHKKEIQWRGLPRTSLNDIEELKYVGLQNLIQRYEQLYSSGDAPSGGVALPFILVQTRPHATVEVEISEDTQLVHFDFNSTPFELHDDNYVLKAMKLCERPQGNDEAQNIPADRGESSRMPSMYQPGITHPSMLSLPLSRTPTSPPLPGILEARVKHEH